MSSIQGKKILLLNGPNLNLLGLREPDIYGGTTLAAIEARLQKQASEAGVALDVFQSNAEAELIDRIQQAPREHVEFILFNPAAYTHTSVHCATRWRRYACHLLKCTYRTSTRASLSGSVPISVTLPSV